MIGPTTEKSRHGLFKKEQQAHDETQNNNFHNQPNLIWCSNAPNAFSNWQHQTQAENFNSIHSEIRSQRSTSNI